jgi:type II secretory ATPase GspE/PulE/Tfp pilus assembly ATPase PilB-like protein
MPDSSLLAAVEVGGYVSLWKLVPLVVVVLVWAKLLTWADKDAIYAHLPRAEINLGLLGGFIAGVTLFFLLPMYTLSLLALVVFFAADVGAYLALRNAKVGLKDLKKEMAETFFTFGRKEKVIAEVADHVQFVSPSGSLLPSPDAEDPVRPIFDILQGSLVDPLRRNAELVEVIPSEQGAVVRYVVDGVGYRSQTLDRQAAGALVALTKKYAAMDVKDKRKPQSGSVKVSVNGKRHDLVVHTAGSSAGETMRIMVDAKRRHDFRLDTIGFNEHQREVIRETIANGAGLVLVAAPKGQGLTSMLYALLRGHDAFVEHIQTVEREPDQDLEGITQNALPPTPGPGEEAKQVDWAASQQPDVLMVSPVQEQPTAITLVNFAKEKRAYVGLRTGSVNDAIAAWRKLVGNDRQAFSQLRMVITGRVVRKLCEACKAGYSPDPNQLRKMNMDPGAVTQLFQARTQPMRNDKGEVIPCTFCNELRFSGRVGVFEVWVVDDDVKTALQTGSANQLKAAFRKQKGKYLQETALEVVERGQTSVQEVLRVLRGPDQQKSQPSVEPVEV